jgi:hypothetical protein
MSSDQSRAYGRSRVFRQKSGIRPEARLPIGVASFDRSRAYDQSRIFQPELGLLTEVMRYLHYKNV